MITTFAENRLKRSLPKFVFSFGHLLLKVFADYQVLKENKLGKLVREKSLLLIALNLIKMTNYFWASASNKTCLIGGNQLISK